MGPGVGIQVLVQGVSGVIIVPVRLVVSMEVTAPYGNDPTFRVRFSTSTTQPFANFTLGMTAANTKTQIQADQSAGYNTGSPPVPLGANLQLDSSALLFGGGSLGRTRFTVAYFLQSGF